MLAVIRRFAKTWPARLLFGALVAAFGLWGVAGRLYNQGGDTAVAEVGSTRVEVADVQRDYSRQIAQEAKTNPGEQGPAMRLRVANEVTQQLILQAALAEEMTRLGLTVPDAAVRDATFALPAFHGISGSFDRATFLSVLSRNGLDEASFIKLVRDDVGRQQLTGAVEAGAAAPEVLTAQIFAFARETRSAIGVSVASASMPDAGVPTDAQLRRFWTNNPGLYATPEYRRLKLIVLSPETLAKDMPVSDEEIRNYYTLAKAEYQKPERRSVQVLTAPDVASATRLAGSWQRGADWAAIQAQSTAAGATALELADAKQIELPDAALGAAAFAAAPDTVSAPFKGDFGWYVVKVTKVTPAVAVTLDQARPQIRDKLGTLKANDAIDDRANKVEDALAGGGGLDTLPQGLGVAAVAGTMDARGTTPDGTPAPLPAFPALRDAIVAEAFKTKPGDAPHLSQLPASKDNPAGAYYALTVDSITPPAQLAYDQVAGRVRQDWTRQQLRHAAETAAAQLLAATRAGTPLVSAAASKGLVAVSLPPVQRPIGSVTAPPGVPETLVRPLFGMKQGEATMVETADGFMVAQLQSIDDPLPSSDTLGAGQLRDELTKSVASDVTDLFVQAIEHASTVSVNQKLIAQIAQP